MRYLFLILFLIACGKDTVTTNTVPVVCHDLTGVYALNIDGGEWGIYLKVQDGHYTYMSAIRESNTYYGEEGEVVTVCNQITFNPTETTPSGCYAESTVYTLSLRNGVKYLGEVPLYPTDVTLGEFVLYYTDGLTSACEI